MSFLASYEGPNSDEYENNNAWIPSYSMSWPSFGPAASEVPVCNMCESTEPRASPAQEHKEVSRGSAPARRMKNPMPESGSRRDTSGVLSIGSQGHESGLCKGPCKDLRSGRGCTWGKKCKSCHLPHPEISSSYIRSKKSKGANSLIERMDAMGLDHEQRMNFFPDVQEGFHAGQQESSSPLRRLSAMPQTQRSGISL
eukprot:TRINITY_DN1477_c1_g2_i1.p1 TRINITY_DN1477_c1_g2~~TRINITY_DN1477_c1_g2_i1.p1  ORF type:complete len:198 (-),score=20.03 TRINITY_DN1477_c1_g2_i1:414-1007(-)